MEGARAEWSHSSFDETKQQAYLHGAHISPVFDLRLLISSPRPAFVSVFVVLGVYYPAIIVSAGRQTHVGLLHPAKLNSPNRKRTAIMLVRQGVCHPLWEFSHHHHHHDHVIMRKPLMPVSLSLCLGTVSCFLPCQVGIYGGKCT